MMTLRPRLLAIFCLLAAAMIGCGTADPLGRQAVTVDVSLGGAPLDQGTIQFEPEGNDKGVGSGGQIASGKFASPVATGLPPGKYRVRIFSADSTEMAKDALPGDSDNPPVAKERIPEAFNVKSETFIDVKAGAENTFKIDIPAK